MIRQLINVMIIVLLIAGCATTYRPGMSIYNLQGDKILEVESRKTSSEGFKLRLTKAAEDTLWFGVVSTWLPAGSWEKAKKDSTCCYHFRPGDWRTEVIYNMIKPPDSVRVELHLGERVPEWFLRKTFHPDTTTTIVP